MMTPFPPKTPMQMRREAEQRGKPEARPLGPPDPSKRPMLLPADSGREVDATIEWLAHLAAGRIAIRSFASRVGVLRSLRFALVTANIRELSPQPRPRRCATFANFPRGTSWPPRPPPLRTSLSRA